MAQWVPAKSKPKSKIDLFPSLPRIKDSAKTLSPSILSSSPSSSSSSSSSLAPISSSSSSSSCSSRSTHSSPSSLSTLPPPRSSTPQFYNPVPDSKAPTIVYVLRHGERRDWVESDWVSRNQKSNEDIPLTQRGKEQAQRVGVWLKRQLQSALFKGDTKQKFQKKCTVYSSPALRCIETSHSVCEAASISEFTIVSEITEIHTSTIFPVPPTYSYLAEQDFALKFPRASLSHFKKRTIWPEEKSDSRHRHHSFLKSLPAKHPGETVLIVTHGDGLYAAANMMTPPVYLVNPHFCTTLKLRYGASPRSSKGQGGGYQARLSHSKDSTLKLEFGESSSSRERERDVREREVWTIEPHDAPFRGRFSVRGGGGHQGHGNRKRKYNHSHGHVKGSQSFPSKERRRDYG